MMKHLCIPFPQAITIAISGSPHHTVLLWCRKERGKDGEKQALTQRREGSRRRVEEREMERGEDKRGDQEEDERCPWRKGQVAQMYVFV